MQICGSVYVSNDYECFSIRCSYCSIEMEVAQWEKFIVHFRNTHGALEEDGDSQSASSSDKKPSECEVMEESEHSMEQVSLSQWTENCESETKVEPDAEETRDGSAAYESDSAESDNTATEIPSGEEEIELAPAPASKFNPSFFRRNPHTLEFILSYKAQPCLWNPEHAKFNDLDACSEAYRQILQEVNPKLGIVLTEQSLKTAIKRLHTQYETVRKRVNNGTLKNSSVAFSYYTSCDFLITYQNHKEALSKGKVQLEFSKKNQLTTDFIQLYANFPQLYDSEHEEFSNMNSRKQAYETMAAELEIPNEDIAIDDVFRAIQNLRLWYYKNTKHTIKVNDSELFYLELCQFMPPKTFKQRLSCEICQKVIFSDLVLQVHLHKEHSIGDLPFKCNLCDRYFVGRGELTTHMQRVHIGKTQNCSYCHRSFAVLSDLRLHIRTHTGLKPYVCELCGKAFRLNSQLKLHVTTIHTKIRAHKCTMCSKDFIKKADLTAHIKSHLNIRDKICDTCGKGFTNCHSLIRHRQIHADIKKFACKLCTARFAQFVGLNSHMKRTHNIVRNKQ